MDGAVKKSYSTDIQKASMKKETFPALGGGGEAIPPGVTFYDWGLRSPFPSTHRKGWQGGRICKDEIESLPAVGRTRNVGFFKSILSPTICTDGRREGKGGDLSRLGGGGRWIEG